jgi:hypothetical protein
MRSLKRDITEFIIKAMLDEGWILNLSSTTCDKAKYSTYFYPVHATTCDECESPPNRFWEECAHGDTIEEAVLNAYQLWLEESK